MKAFFLSIAIALAANATLFAQGQPGFNLIATNVEEWDGAVWIEVDSAKYTYDTVNLQKQYESFNWDAINQNWDKYGIRTNMHDANGNIIQQTYQTWDGLLFVNYSKSEYVYNANGKITSLIDYVWDGASWVGLRRYTSTYDALGNLTVRTRENFSSGVWTNGDRTIYTFAGNVRTTIEVQIWVAGNWTNDRRYVYTINSIGKDSISLGQKWNGTVFENDYRYLNDYDSAGRVVLETYIDWVASAWENISRTSTTFNSVGSVLVDLDQNWNGASWVNSKRNVYTYTNAPELSDTSIRQNWVSSAWQNVSLSTAQYDADGNTIADQAYQWNAGVWDNYYRYFYYYQRQPVVIGISELGNTLEVQAYPVPFNSELNFKLPEGNLGEVKIQLFDLSGKRIFIDNQYITTDGQPISISTNNLPSGQYIFELSIGDKISRGLIAK